MWRLKRECVLSSTNVILSVPLQYPVWSIINWHFLSKNYQTYYTEIIYTYIVAEVIFKRLEFIWYRCCSRATYSSSVSADCKSSERTLLQFSTLTTVAVMGVQIQTLQICAYACIHTSTHTIALRHGGRWIAAKCFVNHITVHRL